MSSLVPTWLHFGTGILRRCKFFHVEFFNEFLVIFLDRECTMFEAEMVADPLIALHKERIA
jgi:hypothetical protein